METDSLRAQSVPGGVFVHSFQLIHGPMRWLLLTRLRRRRLGCETVRNVWRFQQTSIYNNFRLFNQSDMHVTHLLITSPTIINACEWSPNLDVVSTAVFSRSHNTHIRWRIQRCTRMWFTQPNELSEPTRTPFGRSLSIHPTICRSPVWLDLCGDFDFFSSYHSGH